ncbi:MAG: hypothetical protein C5B48_14935 [Candidatus Rokuibacteriota bacterium]|nr:MAG: hypothetical protein C5B48_14935 [Candidatus Rokubacteria bacterium]
MAAVVLVLGADPRLLTHALERADRDSDVVVVDRSSGRLEALERALPDPRTWYLIGEAEIVPLPDASADLVVGERGPDVDRVLR